MPALRKTSTPHFSTRSTLSRIFSVVRPKKTEEDDDGRGPSVPVEEPSVEEKLAALHKEMATLRVECDRLIQKHLAVEQALSAPSTTKEDVAKGRNDTSSAYNTGGDSSRSNSQPPDTRLAVPPPAVPMQPPSPTRMRQIISQDWADPSRFRIPQYSIVLRPSYQEARSKKKETTRSVALISPQPRQFSKAPPPPSSMWQSTEQSVACSSQAPSECREETSQQFKWKVKRRCDGSRYVVRRPVRAEIMKKREAELVTERTGISTDDDAHSELKMGHFFSREERKKHLLRERERKSRQQERALEARRATAGDQAIVQLSQKKMQRNRSRALLDGFTTTAEFLVHGAPSSGGGGILSVTTV